MANIDARVASNICETQYGVFLYDSAAYTLVSANNIAADVCFKDQSDNSVLNTFENNTC